MPDRPHVPQALHALASTLGDERVVVFAGAGISIAPPSSLPSWWTLNQWILDALYRRAHEEFAIGPDYSSVLLAYRDASQSFPPDYQAQFMEECAGLQYFEALTALDVDSPNRCHHLLAALAQSGSLAAVVTTNFDRLIERALHIAGVPFSVACDQAGFERLDAGWNQVDTGVLPIIKIHGSADVVESLVDTRKQRRRGRARALNNIMMRLLRQRPFLFAGFSGADFVHDHHYLGIWDAADDSPGFVFLHQPGRPPEPVVNELQQRFGDKAAVVEYDAADALEHLAAVRGARPAPVHLAATATSTDEQVQRRIGDWTKRLDRWQAIRMAAALQEAASMRVNALAILKAAVREAPGDSPEYSLMLADWVKARLRRARYDDIEMRTAIRELVAADHPLARFYQFLSTAFVMGTISGAHERLETCLDFARDYATILAGHPPTLAVDAVLLVCQVGSLYREVPELVPALRFACDLAERDGDDVRLAAARAELAVRRALGGALDEAEALFEAAMEVANELRERRVASTAMYAHALLQEQRGLHGEAIASGRLAFEQALQDELRLCMSRALLVQLRIACRFGGPGNLAFVHEQMQLQFRHEFWGHELERALYEAEFARRCQHDDAVERLTGLVQDATRAGMTWIALDAARLLKQ